MQFERLLFELSVICHILTFSNILYNSPVYHNHLYSECNASSGSIESIFICIHCHPESTTVSSEYRQLIFFPSSYQVSQVEDPDIYREEGRRREQLPSSAVQSFAIECISHLVSPLSPVTFEDSLVFTEYLLPRFVS